MILVAAIVKPFALGDVKVWTTHVEQVLRVRTGERGTDARSDPGARNEPPVPRVLHP